MRGKTMEPNRPGCGVELDRRKMLAASAATIAAFPSLLSAEQVTSPDSATASTELGLIAKGRDFAVASVSEQATKAAIKVFREGGNAVDAAIAAAMMLAVVDGFNSGIGGGCFILARGADGRILAIDGRETAPALSTATMFIRDGKPDPRLSQVGPLASGVPGAVAAFRRLSNELGTGRWKGAVELAAEQAAAGFEISTAFANRLRSEAKDLALFKGSREVFFGSNDKPLQAGDRLIQKELAETLRELALDGGTAFYEGRVAELVDRWMVENGGFLRKDDFANYRPRARKAVVSTFRGYKILGFPPPSSGGVHVAQILRMLEGFDLKTLHANDPAKYYHVVGEAMRLAFADRAVFLGDPAFAEVPLGLLDEQYLIKRSELIELDRRIPIVNSGAPPEIGRAIFGRDTIGQLPRHTTHLTTADAAGNWVAITATVNTTFGSKVVIPGTGIVMNNQMDDFAIAPGVPNAFGLVGSEANAPAPGKRPLSSMSPTIVLKDDKPILTCGAAGGPRIITATTQILLHALALEMPVDKAIAAPRVHHQWKPDVLYVENEIEDVVVAQLNSLGHSIEARGALGTAQAIASDTEHLISVGEPRLPGVAGGI